MGIFGIKLKLTVPRVQWDRGNMQIHNGCRSLIFELLKCQFFFTDSLTSPTHLLGDEKQGYFLEWPY